MRSLSALALSLLVAGTAAAEELTPERQQALSQLLIQDCGSCHGLQLRGGLGPALLPESLAGKPAEFLVMTIQNGRPGTAMPPWRQFLSRSETEWLVGRLLDGRAVQ